jgi:hypothetical protein
MDPQQKAAVVSAADRLKVTISDLVQGAMRIVSGEICESGWECRRVYLEGDRILAIGEEIPVFDGGIPIPAVTCKIVAPAIFWKTLEASLRDPSSSA